MQTAIPARHRLLAHTADMGVFVKAPDLDGLLASAAQAVTELLVEPDAVSEQRELSLELEAQDPAELLVRWLSEVLFLFETRHFLGRRFQVRTAGGSRLSARIGGEELDFERHRFRCEVKAVTRHRLRGEPTTRGWRAFFIVDL
ncbi:MAG: archease [Candidatus Wallbacteria bacterium]|nr:archease [Candidatus Wallbacteria bacterium]